MDSEIYVDTFENPTFKIAAFSCVLTNLHAGLSFSHIAKLLDEQVSPTEIIYFIDIAQKLALLTTPYGIHATPTLTEAGTRFIAEIYHGKHQTIPHIAFSPAGLQLVGRSIDLPSEIFRNDRIVFDVCNRSPNISDTHPRFLTPRTARFLHSLNGHDSSMLLVGENGVDIRSVFETSALTLSINRTFETDGTDSTYRCHVGNFFDRPNYIPSDNEIELTAYVITEALQCDMAVLGLVHHIAEINFDIAAETSDSCCEEIVDECQAIMNDHFNDILTAFSPDEEEPQAYSAGFGSLH